KSGAANRWKNAQEGASLTGAATKIRIVTVRIDRRIRKLYTISVAVYAVSFVMPAVINPNPTLSFGLVETWGWQAALLSLIPLAMPFAGPSNIGYLLAAAAVPAGWFRAAIALCVVSLGSMIYCGIALPPRPGDAIRFPG